MEEGWVKSEENNTNYESDIEIVLPSPPLVFLFGMEYPEYR